MNPTSSIKSLITNKLSIPTIPAVIAKVTALVADEDTGAAEIGAVVAEDAPLAAKVLRIANSAYYGLSTQCLSTEHASTVLGVRVLRNIVTQIAVIEEFAHLQGEAGFDVEGLWRHSALTGHASAKMARLAKTPIGLAPDELYVCGLLHDVGKIVMLDGMRDAYAAVLKRSKEQNRAIHTVESEDLGFNHTDVGAIVCKRWGLPTAVTSAVQYHHGPAEVYEKDPNVRVVSYSNLLVSWITDGDLDRANQFLSTTVQPKLGLGEKQSAELLEFIQNYQGIGL